MTAQSLETRNGARSVCAASALWGFGYFLRKLILTEISPVLLAFLTAVIVTIVLAIAFRLRVREVTQSFIKCPWEFLGLALTGVALGTSCMFFALRELELGMTTLLEKLQPILVLVFARFFLKERFPIEKSHWVFLAIGSSYVLVSPTPFHFSTAKVNVLGLGGILGAATSWALGTIIGKSVADKAIPSEHITLLRFLFGAIFLLPFFLFREALGLHVLWSIQLVAILVVAAVFSTALGYYLFYRGLADVTAGLSALLELVTPIMGIVLGVLFLNERMTLLQMLAALLLLISVYVLTKPRKFNRV